MNHNFAEKKCVPCEGGIPPLTRTEAGELLKETSGWRLAASGLAISRIFEFKDFKEAMAFANQVGNLAENEGHHPDIRVFSYKNVELSLSTHAVGGLSENDFILAAKINRLPKKPLA